MRIGHEGGGPPSWPTSQRLHSLTPEGALAALDSRVGGLTLAEVEERRLRFGPNLLPSPKRPGFPTIYLRQFKSPLIYLLLIAAAVSLALQEFTDAVFIFAVLQVNALIGALQEWKAEQSAEALQGMVQTWALVVREGREARVASAGVVPGDLVVLESGQRVPADIRLLWSLGLEVDESLLTGESLPVEKDADAVLEGGTDLAERSNMLFAGSVVLRGRGRGVVAATGLATHVGEIAGALAAGPRVPPALLVQMTRLARVIGIATLIAVALLSAAELAQGVPLRDLFILAVALAVAVIPEGLPVAITVALAIATNRMARRNVIVRRLPAVEGLGSCTLIASDKTGTLTCNELTVRRLYVPGLGVFAVSGEGYGLKGEVTRGEGAIGSRELDRVRRLAVTGALCNEANLRQSESGEVTHLGDTVDVAFLVLARKLGLDQGSLLAEHGRVGLIPYEPQLRFAASFNMNTERVVAHVKGAAETVLPMCRDVDEGEILAAVERLARDGYRVLAVASGRVDGEIAPTEAALKNLEFLGLVGLIDPVRPEVPEALQRCAKAGITVCMVTGDHPATAFAIAGELGLTDDEREVVVGASLARLEGDPSALDAVVARSRIFARVEPMQKLAIVQSFRRAGHNVAVTGDGVNDAPALASADIGAAMGRHGTDVAREAADLILTDDNFASIVNGVEEGRVAYDNVRKVVYLLISTGAAAIVLFFLALLFGLPIPLFAAQLLWLNLVTNGVQDVALAFEKGEPDVLKRAPRLPGEGIFNRRMIEQTLIAGAVIGVTAFLFFRSALAAGWGEFEARNALLLLMVCFGNVHTFNCRSEVRSILRVPLSNNPFLVTGVCAAQGIHIAAMYVPGLNDALRIEPVSVERWVTIAVLAIVLVAVMEIYKRLRAPTSAPRGPRFQRRSDIRRA